MEKNDVTKADPEIRINKQDPGSIFIFFHEFLLMEKQCQNYNNAERKNYSGRQNNEDDF